ncbi:MAG: SDR family oxidoreductase [Candidatus Aminicenantes bacterium]|jgi:NAD(P)-dependent dehydrogenase (short-subunit alcohol dehydrogenase family)
MDFSGKFVLVTGGARGIGRAIAKAFAQRGAGIALHYNTNRKMAEDTLASLRGDNHLLLQADITEPASVQQVIETITHRFGALDIVVNNAAVFIPHPLPETDFQHWQEAWQHTLAVNLSAPANLCYWAAQFMIKHGGGRIINISSRGAFRGEPDAPAYGASKAALNAMSQSLAQKLAKHNIFVGVVAPGFVETEKVAHRLTGPEGEAIKKQSPLGRVARPEEVAQAVLFLAAEGSEFMTGTIIDVNGASYLRQ